MFCAGTSGKEGLGECLWFQILAPRGEVGPGLCLESPGACCKREGVEKEAGPAELVEEKPPAGLPGWQFTLKEKKREGLFPPRHGDGRSV